MKLAPPLEVVSERRVSGSADHVTFEIEFRIRWWSAAGLSFWFQSWRAACAMHGVLAWHPLALFFLVTAFPGWPWAAA